MKLEDRIVEFLRRDVGGVVVTGADQSILYSDADVSLSVDEQFFAGCPRPEESMEPAWWDCWNAQNAYSYRVCTRTIDWEGQQVQIHLMVDVSDMIDLYQMTNEISVTARKEGELDGLTGLYNKGKFFKLVNSTLSNSSSVAILNMDVNNLKVLNDSLGHEAGDTLLCMAAESIKRVVRKNSAGFRMGGDEFLLAGWNLTPEEAEELKASWERALADVNAEDTKGIHCVVACGLAYGSGDFSVEKLLRTADARMYEDKKRKKMPGEEIR